MGPRPFTMKQRFLTPVLCVALLCAFACAGQEPDYEAPESVFTEDAKPKFAGYRLKKNALALKTFATMNADKIGNNLGILGKLLKLLSLKSKKSAAQQYIAAMESLPKGGLRGYTLAHIKKRMGWNKTGILSTYRKGKTITVRISPKMLGFHGRHQAMGLDRLDTPSSAFTYALGKANLAHMKKHNEVLQFGKHEYSYKKWPLNGWKGN